MNTEIIVHPKLMHYGLATANLDAIEYATLDDLLGTYTRLKNQGIAPLWAADHGVGTSIYYEDPENNVVELNVDNFGNKWTSTEYLKTSAATVPAQIDVDKMIAGRNAGASPWHLHERAMTREFTPDKPFNPGVRF